MEPANHEEEVATKDHAAVMLVVKGKRTKRVRPHSPMPVVSVDTIAKSDSSPSPETSAETNTAEEDQDMANCLILLAQGPSPVLRHVRPLTRQPPASPGEDVGVGSSVYKYTSRRFLESSAPTTGKGGYYVYECKTCNRTFPSFQALGGHRASHKKPKAQAVNSDEDHHDHRDQHQERQVQSQVVKPINTVSSSTALSLQLRNNPYGANPSYKAGNGNGKVHECSICGAEFTSGQALGGHMRRHRSAPTATALMLSTPLTATRPRSDDIIIPDDRDDHDAVRHGKRARSHVLSLDLDLNLPAPEDDHRESKFGGGVSSKQPQQQKQSSLVFSAPALVDCHY